MVAETFVRGGGYILSCIAFAKYVPLLFVELK